MKGKRKLPWTSAGPAFHLGGFSHLQQCGGSHAHVHLRHLFPAVRPFPPSRAKSCFPCGCPPSTPTLFPWPGTPRPCHQAASCWKLHESRGNKGGSNSLSQPLLLSTLPSSFRLFNPPVSLENQEGRIAAMSETNILVWVQVCQ